MKSNYINQNLNTNHIIKCDNIIVGNGTKRKYVPAISNFNFAFEKGKVYAIIGNSGSGKTTLATHLNGLRKINAGTLFIKDNVIFAKQRKIKNYKAIRKTVGLVFQFPDNQIFKNTIEKDILFGSINTHVNKGKVPNLLSKYMYLVGLGNLPLSANPFDLSNGQKRLVAIAGVLYIESDVVIFDEPTAGLDERGQTNISNIINNLRTNNKTVIIITHNMDKALELADEVLVLHDQKLYQSGTPYQIFENQDLVNKLGITIPKVIEYRNRFNIKDKYPRTVQELAKVLQEGGFNV